jgi:hypothetical protein
VLIVTYHYLYNIENADMMLLWPQNQLPLQINMEGLKDFKEDDIKLGEDSNDQLSSTVCVEQGKITIEEDPCDLPFCVAEVAQEEFKVEEDPCDQLSSDVYVKQEEVMVEEDPSDHLFSAACVKHSDEEERYKF